MISSKYNYVFKSTETCRVCLLKVKVVDFQEHSTACKKLKKIEIELFSLTDEILLKSKQFIRENVCLKRRMIEIFKDRLGFKKATELSVDFTHINNRDLLSVLSSKLDKKQKKENAFRNFRQLTRLKKNLKEFG